MQNAATLIKGKSPCGNCEMLATAVKEEAEAVSGKRKRMPAQRISRRRLRGKEEVETGRDV